MEAADREEPGLLPDAAVRVECYERLAALVERHFAEVAQLAVAPAASDAELDERVRGFDFAAPVELGELLDAVAGLLRDGIVHPTHPRYFGLFNPTPAFAGVLGDALAAAFNPQLAVTSHAPAAVAIERHVLRFLASCLGLPEATGSFTSGGAEANLTALLLARERHFPEATEHGLGAVDGQPTLYVSAEAHHSLLKAAAMSGLGHAAVRSIPVTDELTIDLEALRTAIDRDRGTGRRPFLVVATAGSTAGGMIDPLVEIADLCQRAGLELHVDAAWAGSVSLSERLRPLLAGIERADSVTIDAHKWLSAPMGAGTFLTPHGQDLTRAFRVETNYMPSAESADPYLMSAQWSRRFTGLKVFMALAAVGQAGYATQIEHDCWLADQLRDRLRHDGWQTINDTPLPVVCFIPSDDSSTERLARIAHQVEVSGAAWISVAQLAGRPVLRACITSYRSTQPDIDVLCDTLASAAAATPST